MPIRLDKVIFRAIVYFCRFLKLSPTECFKKLSQAFKSFCYCSQTVANWYDEISTESDIIPEKSAAGRHSSEDTEKRIRAVLERQPNVTARAISTILKIPRTTVRRYLYEVIGLERMKAFFIPHDITEKLRQQRLYFAKVQLSILKQCESCNFANVITGDESWFQYSYFSYYFYLPVGSQRPLVTKDRRGTRKIMIIIFFTGSGCLLLEALDHNSTIDAKKMESDIIPHLQDSWNTFLSSTSEPDKVTIRESTKAALTAGEHTILKNQLPRMPCLPEYQSLPDSDRLMLPIRTTVFSPTTKQQSDSKKIEQVDEASDEEQENGDNYHDEQTLPDCIVISSDDDDEEVDRASKRKAKLILEQLTQEELRFRSSLSDESASQKSPLFFSSSPSASTKQLQSDNQPDIISPDKCLLHMDNASPHNAERVRSVLSRTSFLRFCHPPNSPDLAPSDFWLFSYLKQHLESQNTKDRDSLLHALRSILKEIPNSMWRKVFIDWEHRLEWVISHNGDYYPAHIRKANLGTDISLQNTPNDNPQTPENPTLPKSNLLLSPVTSPSSQSESLLFQPERLLFQNSGNTCYLNSLLQCLLSISSFRCFYLHDIEIITQQDGSKNNLTIIPALVTLLQKIYHFPGYSTSLESHIKTKPFNLKDFIHVIASLHPDFQPGNQGDQHQLFQLLIEWTVCH